MSIIHAHTPKTESRYGAHFVVTGSHGANFIRSLAALGVPYNNLQSHQWLQR